MIVTGNYTVGNIIGAGNTTVYDQGSLTAVSIVQNTLTIGGIMPTTAVPEPSVVALLGVAAIGLFSYGWRRKRRVV